MSNYPNVVKGLLYKKNYSVTKRIYYSGQTKTYGHPLCVFFKDGDAEDNQFPFTTEKRSDQSAIDSSKALFLSEEDANKWPEGDYAFLSREEITAVRIDIDSNTPIYVNIRWVQGYINRKEENKINPIIIERLKEAPQSNPFTAAQQAKLDAKKDEKKEFIKWFKTLYPQAVSGEDWVALTIKDLAPQSHIKSKTRSDCEIWFKLLSNKVKVIIANDLYITKHELFLSDKAFDKIAEIYNNPHRKNLEDVLGNQTATIAWNIYSGDHRLYLYDRGWTDARFINVCIELSNIADKRSRKVTFAFSTGIDDVTFTYNQAIIEIPKIIDKLKTIFQNDFKSEGFKQFESKLETFDTKALEEKIHLYEEDVEENSTWSPPKSSVKQRELKSYIKKFSEYLLSNYAEDLMVDDINSILKKLHEDEDKLSSLLNMYPLSFSAIYSCFKEFDIDLFDYDITNWDNHLYLDSAPKEGYFVLPKKVIDSCSSSGLYLSVNGGGSWGVPGRTLKIYIEEGVKDLNNVYFSCSAGNVEIYLPDSLEFLDVLNINNPYDTYFIFNPIKDKEGKLMSAFTVNKWEIENENKKICFIMNKTGRK